MHELVPSASLAGTVALDGVDIYRADLAVTEIRRRIGMVFQKPNPFPAMTIAENVLAGPEALRASGARDHARARRELPAAGRPLERGEEPARRRRRRRCRAASSSGCASRARSPCSRRCC